MPASGASAMPTAISKPPEEMARLFQRYPEALARTLEIAERCRFSLDELRLSISGRSCDARPDAAAGAGEADLGGRRRSAIPKACPTRSTPSLEHELRLIESCEYAPYFLTVNSIVRFARSQDILCQGRGSAANTAVCYVLGITSIDPERNDLLFERFVSEERREPPDIDVDFEHERRETSCSGFTRPMAATTPRCARPSSATAPRARCAMSARRWACPRT